MAAAAVVITAIVAIVVAAVAAPDRSANDDRAAMRAMRQLIADNGANCTADNCAVRAAEALPGQRTNASAKQCARNPVSTGMCDLMGAHAAGKH